MNTIPINQIAPSPNPVRKTWDEGKMEELAQSIRERGVIVPIKVRPNGKGYEVVYGHRRVEAARRAGLQDMPAIIEGVDDEDAIWEALIENLSNEDMTAYEKGEEIEKLKQKGYSVAEQSRQIGVHEEQLRVWQHYYLERNEGVKIPMIIGKYSESEMVEQVVQVRRSLKDDMGAKQAVIDKAARDNLDRFDTRAVADAYKAADTPELKQKVLETSGKLGDSERILATARMKLGGDALIEDREIRKREAFQEWDSAVKEIQDYFRLSRRMIKAAQDAAKYGKFSPEGARFTVNKIDELINELQQLKEVLSDV